MAQRPQGPIFRNTDGLPWTPFPLNCRFKRLRLSLGRQQIEAAGLQPPKIRRLTKAQRSDPAVRTDDHGAVIERRQQIASLAHRHGPKCSLYTFRHSWATRTLERGVDAVTVSVLLGHRDTTMLSRVYSHPMQRRDHLLDALRKA